MIAPRSIALIGAGAWTDAVAAGNVAIGYSGTIWRVHPTRPSTPTTRYFRTVDQLPGSPDAAFIAVPARESPDVAQALAARGAGGFVCFSSGFAETGTENGHGLARDLKVKAGTLPFFGPNCYGFVNFFDRVAMMPDQIVGSGVERGVALICQSGTIALTLMFNHRSLPVGYVFTVGNQACLAVEDLIEILCDDERVSAFGLYLEGVKDPVRFAHAVDLAKRAGKPVAVIKSGRTEAAARVVHSHTGALAGADRVFDAFCRQSGVARCDTLATLCETLKVLHAGGPLAGNRVLVLGASGGDMAMASDLSDGLDLNFSSIPQAAAETLETLLTQRVKIANPLDIHTYLWFDPPALQRVFAALLFAGYDAVAFMLDSPPEAADTRSFDAVIDAFIAASRGSTTRAVLLASLPETLSERVRKRCSQSGVIPLQGLREALEAISLTVAVGSAWRSSAAPCLNLASTAGVISAARETRSLNEFESKLALQRFGLEIPRGKMIVLQTATSVGAVVAETAAALRFPLVLKAIRADLEHKSDLGAVILDLRTEAEVMTAAERLADISRVLLLEEMCSDGSAEIIIGVRLDAHFGQVLTLGAGGIFTELMADSVCLLPPWTRESIEAGFRGLTVAKRLAGYRGQTPADWNALIEAALSVTAYATAHVSDLVELDVNPVIVRPAGRGAVAVDALIRLRDSASSRGD